MATFTVTTAADVVNAGDGVLSLREAVQHANATVAADTIVFANVLEGSTLTLTQGQLTLSSDTLIDGDQDNSGSRITISGGDRSRVLASETGVGVDLRDLTVADGLELDGDGGGINVGAYGSLTLNNSTVRDCSVGEYFGVYRSGGGIFAGASSTVTVSNSSLLDNSSSGGGGAIHGSAQTAIGVSSSTVARNFGYSGGGISAAGTLSVSESSITNNGARVYNNDAGPGGGGVWVGGSAYIDRTHIASNGSTHGGGIASAGRLFIRDSTIANNNASGDELPGTAAGLAGSDLTIIRCTVTGNRSSNDGRYYTGAAGIGSNSARISDSIVVGNYNGGGPNDISGSLVYSNGRNIFGSSVSGSVAGDLENVDPLSVFAAIDPARGGGQLARIIHRSSGASLRRRS